MTDHYTALGLDSAATLADVKKAFRQKASFWHPDKNASPEAPERFRAVQQAYEVLSDADKRQAYDDNRRRNLLGGGRQQQQRRLRRLRVSRPPPVARRPPPAVLPLGAADSRIYRGSATGRGISRAGPSLPL